MQDKIRLGISSCLLGHNVRFDGGHKMNRYLHDTLAPMSNMSRCARRLKSA